LAISSPKGIPGKQLLRFAGTIDHDDIQAIEQAIEAECEKVDEFAISASALACGLDTAREYGVITRILSIFSKNGGKP